MSATPIVHLAQSCPRRWPRWALLALLGVWIAALAGCERGGSDAALQPPAALSADDECHVCGMLVTKFPGPKGQAYLRGRSETVKYCSTRELLSHVLQPDVRYIATGIYVHDMAGSDWDHPVDAPFIDARTAWYVIGHGLPGAMGATLASFADEAEAERFAQRRGGRVLTFDELTPELLASLDEPSAHPAHHP